MVDSFTILQQSEFRRRTGQLIAVEIERCQLGKLPNLGRDGACQRILRHKPSMVDSFTISQQSEFRRRTGQLIGEESELCQLEEVPDLGRNRTFCAQKQLQDAVSFE